MDIRNIPVYYISFTKLKNLEDSFIKNGFTNVTHFNSVKGKELNLTDLLKKKIIGTNVIYNIIRGRSDHIDIPSMGGIGCYLSHYLLWKKVVDNNLPFMIICEDDFILDTINTRLSNLNQSLHKLYNTNINTIGLLYYHSSFFNKNTLQKKYNINNKDFEGLYYFFGMQFYIVSNQACKNLLNYALPINAQVDAYISELGNNQIINIAALKENVGYTDNSISTIQDVCIKCFLPKNIYIYIILVFVLILFTGILVKLI